MSEESSAAVEKKKDQEGEEASEESTDSKASVEAPQESTSDGDSKANDDEKPAASSKKEKKSKGEGKKKKEDRSDEKASDPGDAEADRDSAKKDSDKKDSDKDGSDESDAADAPKKKPDSKSTAKDARAEKVISVMKAEETLADRINAFLAGVTEDSQVCEMDDDLRLEIIDACEDIFDKEGRVVSLKKVEGKVIVLGDTHGDYQASKKVVNDYINEDVAIIFLGDFVDRGAQSHENLMWLLMNKILYPDKIFLIMGNHEAFDISRYQPAEFWFEMRTERPDLYRRYADMLLHLPYMIDLNENALMLHGGLPMCHLSEVENVQPTPEDRNWFRLTWGDFTPEDSFNIYISNPMTGRDAYTQEYFDIIMDNILERQVLIRGHDVATKGLQLFDHRCLTIFTSAHYANRGPVKGRLLGIIDMENENNHKLKSTEQIEIVELP